MLMPFPAKTGRERILAAAIEIILESGYASLSMRELGKRLSVRPSSLYHHFADRNELEASLAEPAAKALLEAMRKAAERRKGAARLKAIAEGYVAFAQNQPALYDLGASAKPVWDELTIAVAEAAGKKNTAATTALWSLLHGFVALQRKGSIPPAGIASALDAALRNIL